MIKLKYLLFIVPFSFLFISCENNFSPKIDAEEKYILYSIIETNQFNKSTKVEVVLSKVYDVDGFDPYLNHTDPNILGAKVKLKAKYNEFDLPQDTTNRKDTSRYSKEFIYYGKKDDNMVFVANEKLSIEAILPNGKRLTAEAKAPTHLLIDYSYDYVMVFTPYINRFTNGDEWVIYWETPDVNHLYFVKFVINYSKKENGVEVPYQLIVPNKYVTQDGKKVPYYVNYTYANQVSYNLDAVIKAIEDISLGEPDKSKFKLINAQLQIVDFDENLAKYYGSTHGSLDEFSIRVDDQTFTNISGGLGIFGVLRTNNRDFNLALDVSLRNGYRPN